MCMSGQSCINLLLLSSVPNHWPCGSWTRNTQWIAHLKTPEQFRIDLPQKSRWSDWLIGLVVTKASAVFVRIAQVPVEMFFFSADLLLALIYMGWVMNICVLKYIQLTTIIMLIRLNMHVCVSEFFHTVMHSWHCI